LRVVVALFRFHSVHPEAERIQTAVYRRMTVEAKLRAAQSLREFAWELKRATIQRRYPHMSESEVLAQVRAIFRDGTT
jgi:hypothetical protein